MKSGSEGAYIGWQFEPEDVRVFQDDEMSEFDLFLEYHEITAQDYQHISNNERRNMWWNFRKFGKRES